MNLVDKIKKVHGAMNVEKKDKSLKEIVQDKKPVTVTVTAISSKFVPKYFNEQTGQKGMYTILYTEEHGKIGAFSNAMYEFGAFFFDALETREVSGYKKVEMDGNLKVSISKVDLDGGKSTYNFEILEGTAKGFRDGLSTNDSYNLMLEG